MADRRAVGILRHIGDASRSSLPDAALLAWFATERDEAAFAELVRRHGPLVLGICRRVTRHQQDAEDAFQATFLILAAKAGRVARPEVLANWLYGVAYRVARRARRAAARRRAREGQVADMPEPAVLPPELASDLAAFLDEELAALPERFRAAILLCDLYELPRAAAAERLGIPEGTLSSRLNAGRKKLAARLARRGVTIPAAGLGAALGGRAGGVPPTLAARTVSAVLGGVISATVRQLALTGGASMAKAIGWATAACAAIGLAAGVVSALPGDEPAKPAKPAPAAKAAPAAKVEEPGTGTIPSRPRMVRRMEMVGQSGQPIWSPDGKWLALPGEKSVGVYDAANLKLRVLVQTGQDPKVIGFFRDQPMLVTYRKGAGEINAESKLAFWKLPGSEAKNPTKATPAEPEPPPVGSPPVSGLLAGQPPSLLPPTLATPTEVTLLSPDDGAPLALLPGDKSVMCAVERATLDPTDKSVRYDLTFRTVSLGTGQPIREVFRLPGYTNYNSTYKLSSDGQNLFVGSFEDGICSLERWAVKTGKRVWRKELAKLDGWEGHRDSLGVGVIVSPDGELLAANAPRKSAGPNPFSGDSRLFDAATGTEGTRLEGQLEGWSHGMSFSSDGRLLVGSTTEGKLGDRLQIWDTKSGKVLKSWQGLADAQFSPAGPALAILEHSSRIENNEMKLVSILGLWDVAPLLKAADAAK